MSGTHKEYDKDAWDNRELGATEEFVKAAAPERNKEVDDALGLQLISMRFQKDIIAKLKEIAVEEGIGYQPLIRQVMNKFVRERYSEKTNLKKAR